MKKSIILFFIFSISFIGFSQITEKAYIQDVKYQYVKGDFNKAKDYLENAIEKYPNSKELFKLKGLVEEDGDLVVEIRKPQTGGNSGNTGGGKVEGGKTGTGGNSGIGKTGSSTQVEQDPDGDGFIGSKDKCPNDYGEVNGCPDSDGDGVYDKIDKCPDVPGDRNNSGCKAIQKPIPYNFRMQAQNVFVWNPKIAESGVKTIITVDNYSGKKPKTFDVTGKSSLNVVTKDSNYDGVECLITLTIQGDPGFKITGGNQLSETISCSGNNN
jgi:hypothetical protein